ncbi:uncharacterized protein ColSpa_09133 [Colletotrichum spaethianum]|uniref:Methyltransferase n=1 Tax=Colletotrichum spaethianum TaxID=700344 RepID=A0AA37PB31_9PEZI|nr:uncharacterized protein ColSpa_09133 [Colletotrichum spaethianum]GKT48952.1 hypothetical protein ColSpa_09133 [Colletotrichum spaethianum]
MPDARPADGDATTMTPEPDAPVVPAAAAAASHPAEAFFQFRLSDLRLLDVDDELGAVAEQLYLDSQHAGTDEGLAHGDAESERPSVDATEDGVTVDRVTVNDAASLASIDDISLAGGQAPSLWSLETSDYENGFQERHGRTYHPIEEYILPNDTTEQFRLGKIFPCGSGDVVLTGASTDIQHLLWLATWDGRLCMCPKKDGASRVLDVGTGTGVWAMAYGEGIACLLSSFPLANPPQLMNIPKQLYEKRLATFRTTRS